MCQWPVISWDENGCDDLGILELEGTWVTDDVCPGVLACLVSMPRKPAILG